MERIPEGTLVRAKKEELDKNEDGYILDRHGYLWVVLRYLEPNHGHLSFDSYHENMGLDPVHGYTCKSLATGQEEHFLVTELETLEENSNERVEA